MAVKTHDAHAPSKQHKSPGLVQDVEKDAQPFLAFFTKFNNDWVMNLAAALAYNLLTAIFPIAIAILSILGLILGHLSLSSYNNILNSLANVFPSTISSNKDLLLTLKDQLARVSGPLGIIAVLVAIFGGSRLFTLMEGCFDIIYHVKPRGPIQQNVMAIGMLLLFVILVPIMILASSGPALVFSLLKYTPLASAASSGPIVFIGGVLSGLIVSFILFLAIYIVVPNKSISFGDSWLGALVAAVLLEVFLTLFPLYVTHFMVGYAGAVGFAVILLAFFYYFAVILLLGVEINAFFAEKVVSTPVDLATIVYDWTNHMTENEVEREKTASIPHKPINPGSQYSLHPVEETTRLGQKAKADDKNPSQHPERARKAHEAEQSGKPGKAGHSKQSTQTVHSTQETDEQAVQTARGMVKKAQKQGKQEKTSSSLADKVIPIAEAVAGTALAFVVELVRLSRKNKTRKPAA